jgi:glycosyltransferase involved in cell wall biosynthesis
MEQTFECLKSGDVSNFLEVIKDVIKPITTRITPLVIPKVLPDEFRPSAVSVVNYPFANVRHVTFLPPIDGSYKTKDGSPIRTENLYVNLETGELIVQMNDKTVDLPRRYSSVQGLEDIRLFIADNKLKFIATNYHEYSLGIGMVSGEYNIDGTYSNCKYLPSPLNEACEKNWLPILDSGNLIYSWNPFRIVNNDIKICKQYSSPNLFKLFRGSCPPVMIDDKLICMVHFVDYCKLRKYYHAFVELDKETYIPIRVSVPFVFKSISTEYCVSFRNVNETTIEAFPSFMDSDPSSVLIEKADIRWIDVDCKEMKTPKIGLCMIVRNESHIVNEVLTATLPLIDTYSIVDTGSTDNTIEIIRKFYQKHNVEGDIHEREWKNFGHNRSEALKLCDEKMDYILVIDADDLISWNGDGKQELLKLLQTNPNVVNFMIRQGDLSYTRMQMFKANDGWKYFGVLHEYPGNGKQNHIVRCPDGMFMTSRRLGDRSKCNDKMKRDIGVLLKGLEEEPDNERYMFYLAQSYRDDGQTDKAVEWYTKRYEIGRWYEEKYISAYNVAKLTNSKEWAWKAHECNPKRIECLVSYLSFCRSKNIFTREVLAMALYASSIQKPTDQHLFLENDVYDWKIWDELSIIAYYCGFKDLAKTVSEKLMSENKAPSDQMVRIKNNYRFSADFKEISNIIRVPEKVNVYWLGKYSEFRPNKDIETYLKTFKNNKFILTQSDGFFGKQELNEVMSTTSETRIVLSSEEQYENLNSLTKDGIVCALATRGFSRKNILYLPFDDETFTLGIDHVFKDVVRPSWESRRPIAFWRGNIGGYERPSIRELVVKKLFENQNADVKFAFSWWNGNYAETIDKKYIEDQRCELQEFVKYKFLFIMDGVTIASNHQWTFASGAVPIMITHPENNWWFKRFLVPMKHYVSVKYDLSDLKEKIEWLVNNDDKAREIAENALALSKEIFTHEYQCKYITDNIRSILRVNNDSIAICDNSFKKLGTEAGTDKISHHGYDRFYCRYLDRIKDSTSGMLEIGIAEHNSIFLWKKYFLNAHIYGIDIDEKTLTDERVTIFKADQNSDTDLRNVVTQINHPVQFIIDDGSHIPEHQILSFNILFETLLEPGGVYIVEDIETSYWTHGGLYGYDTNYGYRHPDSFIEKVKPIIDKINCEFLLPVHNNQNNEILHNFSEKTLCMISTITFGQNCVIFTKKLSEDLIYNNRDYRFKDNL